MNTLNYVRKSVFALLVLYVLSAAGSYVLGQARSFPNIPVVLKNPPASNRLIAWWIWYGPAVTKAEVHRELETMHAAGVGGVLIYPSYPQHIDDPKLGIRNLRFLSPDYLKVYAYAIRFAHRLGMTVDVVGGSGWPFGGPTVSIDDASRSIRMVRIDRDSNSTIKSPLIASDEKLIAAFMVEPMSLGSSFRNITEQFSSSGRLPQGFNNGASLLFFISSPTRMHVKRPSYGGDGYVLDHLSSQALAHYESSVLDKLTAGIIPSGLRAIFTDSLEAYGSDWTNQFTQEFRQQRGYEIVRNLPYLSIDLGRRTEDVRFDYWETISQLFVDDYVRPLQKWAHEHGIQSEMQAYGVPAVPQRAYEFVDLPGGEQYDWREFTEGRWASSAAHFYSKKQVLAEYATWAGMPNRFTDTLDDLKLIADLQFLTGMTEMGASTLPYSPPAAGVPGWQDYSGAAFGLNQTWWPFFHHLTEYIDRASSVLEQGKPVSDTLLYLPVEDVEAHTPPGNLHTVFRVRDDLAQAKEGEIPEFGLMNALTHSAPIISAILDSGYTFDGISGDILGARARVVGGRLVIGDGSYRLVILPRLYGMRLSALEKLADFVRSGGSLIAVGRLPDRVYSGLESQDHSRQLQSLVRSLFGSEVLSAPTVNAYGQGHAIYVPVVGPEFVKALQRTCPPDLSFEHDEPDVGFVHRRLTRPGQEEDYYFIVNTSQEPKNLRASFRVDHREPVTVNLENGDTTHPAAYEFVGNRTNLQIYLGPRRSLLVYFGDARTPAPISASNLPGAVVNNGAVEADVGGRGRYFIETRRGRTEHVIDHVPKPVDVPGAWQVDFGPRLNLSESMATLRSWTTDSQTRYFCGTATYKTDFRVPPTLLDHRLAVWLELGTVKYAARVFVNGHMAGDVWQPPFRIQIGNMLIPGRNELTVKVANLLINCLLGQKPPDYSSLIEAYGDRFPYPDDWKQNPDPWPSGLFGPVRLVPEIKLRFPLDRQ